jgi:hypothetical protein
MMEKVPLNKAVLKQVELSPKGAALRTVLVKLSPQGKAAVAVRQTPLREKRAAAATKARGSV